MKLDKNWTEFLKDELQSSYFLKLQETVENEYKLKTIYPAYNNIFRAFNLINHDDVKVVIIGQDPYHGEDQANGLAFSVCDKCKIPPSLRNIFKELIDDMGCNIPTCGNLQKWAQEGVLLINSVFTVEKSMANSHKGLGWEIFTDNVITKLSKEQKNIVFILWGGPSQKKEKLIDTTKHCVLKSPHPSPLSSYRGFFGSKPFSKANEYLVNCGKKEIDWCLD